tara:strand:- start:59 stop:469 length:411 start_codon:yes stop_codon:yes gene_type:complete
MSSIEVQAYAFTEEVVKLLLEKFEGKEVGSDEMTLELVMSELSPDYKPGDKIKKKKKSKKVTVDEDGNPVPKKKKAPTGYTFFGKENKEKINTEIQKEVDDGNDKPSYVAMQGKLWKKLTDEEKAEWSEKAKASVQ